jgi:23S rRNA U2552 (ribose-2'-O)-methylase RlmE/FtsJ
MKVVAVDLLPMKEVEGVDFYNIDARNPSFHRLLK